MLACSNRSDIGIHHTLFGRIGCIFTANLDYLVYSLSQAHHREKIYCPFAHTLYLVRSLNDSIKCMCCCAEPSAVFHKMQKATEIVRKSSTWFFYILSFFLNSLFRNHHTIATLCVAHTITCWLALRAQTHCTFDSQSWLLFRFIGWKHNGRSPPCGACHVNSNKVHLMEMYSNFIIILYAYCCWCLWRVIFSHTSCGHWCNCQDGAFL